MSEPRWFRYHTARDVTEGDWLVLQSARAECGERWFTVLTARQVRTRKPLPDGERVWSVQAIERQTPTSADPSIPEDFPDRHELIHFAERRRR